MNRKCLMTRRAAGLMLSAALLAGAAVIAAAAEKELALAEARALLSSAASAPEMAVTFGALRDGTRPPDIPVDAGRREALGLALGELGRELEALKPEKSNPVVGWDVSLSLRVKTGGQTWTVQVRDESWVRVESSGAAEVFRAPGEAWRQVRQGVEETPGVMAAKDAAERKEELQYQRGALREPLAAAGTLLGDGTALLPRREKNPPALAINPDETATIQLYDGSGRFVLVTEQADKIRLCNLVNVVDAGAPVSRRPALESVWRGLRLEIRGTDGVKHEYQQSDSGSDNLVADGKKYGDERVTAVFSAVLAETFLRYPAGAGWLGYMNPGRIVKAEYSVAPSLSGTAAAAGTGTFTAASQPQRVREIAGQLRNLRVCEPVELAEGDSPPQLRRHPDESWRLTFDSGVEYRVHRYGGRLSVRSSDMDRWWMYLLA